MKNLILPTDYINKLLDNKQFYLADVNQSINNSQYKNIINCLSTEISKQYTNKQLSVVILLERNIYYLASMFATWKSNSYFIPLNTKWPINRINTIVKHCDADVVICHKEGDYHDKNALYIEDIDFEKEDSSTLKHIQSKPSDLAYIIYTSGSTGTPKGVMITNESYRHYIEWTKRFFSDYSDNRSLLLTAELTFDITMGDIAFALAFGTSIVISPDTKNMITHLKLIEKYKIDTFYSVPTTHNALFNFVKRKKSLNVDSINLILSGGDAFSVELIKVINDVTNGAHFYNVYGPTEITINCFATRVDNLVEKIEESKLVPIGKPFDIIDAVIIDGDNKDITEEQKVGKLFVSGPQTMLGYLDDDGKTSDAFILDPRYPKFKRKIYNTGDLAIKKEDSLFYLLGRSDDIVKIKGYRVNPTEVNNILSKHTSIKESATIAFDKNNGNILVTFIVLIKNIDIDEIISFLKTYLPEYMIPTEFIILKSLPLNNSGKINKLELKNQYNNGELS